MKLTAVFIALSLVASQSFAEKRFLGHFDTQGQRVYVDVDPALISGRPIPAGHLPDADLQFMPATKDRLSISGNESPQKLDEIVTKRFAKAAKKLRETGYLPSLSRIARLYGVDPAALAACLLGELTFNNDFSVAAQNLAAKNVPSFLNFRGAAYVESLTSNPALQACDMNRSDYWSWVCVNQIWNTSIHKSKNGPNTAHIPASMLLPLSPDQGSLHGTLRPMTGVSYGLGQLSLYHVLKFSADVASRSNYPLARLSNMPGVLGMAQGADSTLHIVAAGLRRSIDVYKRFVGIDISPNIGLQATLFNLGNEFDRAAKLRTTNRELAAKGVATQSPRENYFGWWMNRYENEIRALVRQ